MASNEDIDCLGSICQALRDVLVSPAGLTAESEEQVLELLALLPEVFATDPHAGRTAQLLHVCHPIAVVAQYLSPRWLCSASVRARAMQSVSAIVTGPAVQGDPTERLRNVVGEHLRESSVAAHVIHLVATSHTVVEVSHAAELLFILAMTVRSVRDDIRRVDDGIEMILHRALQRPNSPQVQGYLAGVLRVLSETFADVLSAEKLELVPRVLSALAYFSMEEPSLPLSAGTVAYGGCTSRRAAVLLLETLTEVLAAFPTAYWAAIGRRHFEDASVLPLTESLPLVLDVFFHSKPSARIASLACSPSIGRGPQEATVSDCVESASALLRIVLKTEGRYVCSRDSVVQPVLYRAVSTPAHWKEVCGGVVSTPSLRPRLYLLRESVVYAYTYDLQLPLVSCFLEAFPLLCGLLVPEKSHPTCMSDAALIVALMLVKAPSARLEVRKLVAGYDAWAAQMSARIQSVVRGSLLMASPHEGGTPNRRAQQPEATNVYAFLPSELLLVDVFQTILNDGDQAQHIDMLQEERVAKALLHEQQRRASSQVPPIPLDTAFLAAFSDPQSAAVSSRARELCLRLALAVLQEGTNLAFTDAVGPAHADPMILSPAAVPGSPTLPGSRGHSSPGVRSQKTPRATSPRAGGRTLGRPSSQLSRYQEWIDQVSSGSKPKNLGSVFDPVKTKTPFRPSSKAVAAPVSGQPSVSPPPSHVSPPPIASRSSTPRVAPASGKKGTFAGKSILDVVRDAPLASDEYLSMAIMLHLPIRFGPHYNRNAKAAIRKVLSPQGLFVQPIRRDSQQSWSASDVKVGELHVIFIPFHKLSCQRVEEEIAAVDRHLVEMNKLLVTTPTTQRTRRWFLRDMVTDVLPKIELLLRDLLDLLFKFGVDDVVYQLSLIRVAEEGKRQTADLFSNAVEIADTAMPAEILRLSSGAFRDILHSGNIVFAVQQLRAYYYEANVKVGDDQTTQAQWNTLVDVDNEIRTLEKRKQDVLAPSSPNPSSPAPAATATSLSPLRYAALPVSHHNIPGHLLAKYRHADLAAEEEDETTAAQIRETAADTAASVYQSIATQEEDLEDV